MSVSKFTSPIYLLFFLLLIFTGEVKAQSKVNIGEKIPEISITDWIANTPTDTSLEGKFIVLDFWATWCGPCIASVPHFNDLQAYLSDREDVLFLSLTYESPEKVNKLLNKVSFQTPVATDQRKATQQRFEIRSIPHTLVIDPHGILLWKGHPGQLGKKELKKLLAESN